MSATPLLKISTHHYRDPSCDEETFTKWYHEEQMPRFVPIAQKHGIEGVELLLSPNVFKEKFQADLEELHGGADSAWKMAPYDATIVYWVSDPQKIRNMLSDPEFHEKVIKPEAGYIDLTKQDVQVGTQTTYIQDGKKL